MFNSNNFKETTGGPKLLEPGTHYVRIVDLFLEKSPFQGEEDAYFVTLKVEGKDQGDDFEGMMIDKNNPSLGRYRGKAATVRSKRGSFKDYEYEGRPVKRDQQIFNWINNLAKQWGVLGDMNKANVNGDTIEEYVENARRFIVNPEVYGYMTLGGSEYFSEGYDKPNYNMFFPNIKLSEKTFPFVACEEVDDEEPYPTTLTGFNAEAHIVKKKRPENIDDADSTPPAPVNGFEKSTGIDSSFPDPNDKPMSDMDLPM
jgi:hypothetical protein